MGIRMELCLEEIWKDIVNYEGYYQISNFGNVRSLDRVIKKSNGVYQPRRGAMLKKILNEDGYPTVKLSKDGCSNRVTVHRLVAIAFVPNPNNLPEVNHIDFDRHNSMASNLEWVDHKENIHYTIKAGRHNCNRDLFGSNNPNYKNTTLKEFYREHPEEKEKLVRKGSQNGMAKPVMLISSNGDSKVFGYLRECADYLIKNHICKQKNRNGVSNNISKAIKNNETYCNCHFSRV